MDKKSTSKEVAVKFQRHSQLTTDTPHPKRSDGWRYHKDWDRWINLAHFRFIQVIDGEGDANSRVVAYFFDDGQEIIKVAITIEECQIWLQEFMNQ